MYIEQVYTGCLAEAAYYIESDGQAAVIDPMRDIQSFLPLASKRKAVIRYVFETHFHADFVSGHLDLAAKTGAKIVFGPGAKAGYEIHEAVDGEEFELGSVKLKLLHTPGHTLESSCILLLDERNNPHSVFTGDTLFVDEVGRPDLAADEKYTREELAGMLYDSIQAKLVRLPNYVVMYPGHGEGSACGKSIGTDRFSTIGAQKQTNYALKVSNRNDFIQQVIEGLTEPPKYYFMDAAINRKGYSSMDSVIQSVLRPLKTDQVIDSIVNRKAIILDTRSADDFAKGFIPGSINIGLEGWFAVTAGTVLDPGTPLILLVDEGRHHETVTRLARVGYENVIGYLQGGYAAWVQNGGSVDTIENISSEDFESHFSYNSCIAIDVRNANEWVAGFVAGAKLISLPKLAVKLKEIDSEKVCFIYCGSGYRSMVAASILKRNGFKKIVNVVGGMNKIRKTSITLKQLSIIND